MIAPVQVFEHQQQGRVNGQRVHHLGKLAEHAFARGALQFLTEQLAVLGPQEPWHLHEPGGSTLAQQRDELLAARRPTESTKRLQDRQISFARTVLLHTLPVCQPYRGVGGDLRCKRLDYGSLTNPRLPSHPDDLALSLAGLGPSSKQTL